MHFAFKLTALHAALLLWSSLTVAQGQASCSFSNSSCCRDSDCGFYDDCCRRSVTPRSALLHCHSLVLPSPRSVGSAEELDRYSHYWIVARCPKSSSLSGDHQRCTQPQSGRLDRDSLPVWGVTGRLYTNGHCLRCNGDEPDEVVSRVAIGSNVACKFENIPSSYSLDGLLLPNGCRVHHYLHSRESRWSLRPCPLIDSCPFGTEENLTTECRFGPAEWTRFRNASDCYARNSACSWCNSNATTKCDGRRTVQGPMMHSPDPVDLIFNFRLDYFARVSNESSDRNDTTETLSSTDLWLLNTQASLLAASDAGLVCVLATYASFATLRNRAGLLLMSHSVALLLVNSVCLLWLLWPQTAGSTPLSWPLLPPVIVFCFNSAFAWAALFGVDLLRTLRATMRPASSRSPRYLRFALLGWGVPALLAAAVAAALQFGRQLSTQEWRILQACLVFAPWLLTLLFNACVLALLWYRLFCLARQTNRTMQGPDSATSAGTANQTDLLRLAGATGRVSVLLGLCWLPFCLAVLTNVSQTSPLYFAATTARNLHGLLLSAAFVGSRRVRRQVSSRASTLSSAISRRFRRPAAGHRPEQQQKTKQKIDEVDKAATPRRCFLTVGERSELRRISDAKTTEIFS